MSYTKFGEFMRILRVRFHEVMGDTARLFDVRVPFVSAVENGKKNIPEGWIPKLIEHYNLNDEEQRELYNAVDESKTQMKINLNSATDLQRRVAIQFQRSFDNLDDETANEIMKILNKKES